MSNRPTTVDAVEKAKNTYHFIMTGWRGQYNIKHERHFKIPYSSHSSSKELAAFVKAIRPHKLTFNLRQF